MADSSHLPVIRQSSPPEVSFDEMERMAVAFAKSNLFGVKTPEAALSLLMIAQAEGIHPALAVMEYDIIEGKPARKAERLLARFQMSGGKVEWLVMSEQAVKGKFTHPMGSDAVIEWTIAQAAKVQYYTKDGWKSLAKKHNWSNYPRAMLRARVISEGVRTCFPGASLVTLTSEEAIDAQVMSVETIHENEPAANDGDEPITGIIPETFTKGAAAVAIVDSLIERMRAATSEGELTTLLREVRALKGKVSANRIFAMEEEHANNEVRIANENLDRASEGDTDGVREIAKPQTWAGLDQLKADLEAASTKDALAECSATIRTNAKSITKEQRVEISALHAQAKARVNG